MSWKDRACVYCGSLPRPIPETTRYEEHWIRGDEKPVCGPCVVTLIGEAERAWLSERLGYTEDRHTAAEILRRLYGPK